MTRLGDAEGGADEGIFELVSQLEHGMAMLGVFPMRHLVVGVVGFEGLAGGAPELLGALNQVAVGDLPLGVVQQLEGQAGVLVGFGFGGGYDGQSRVLVGSIVAISLRCNGGFSD